MNQRAAGILLHPTSLSNSYPIGDLGPAATAFADFMVVIKKDDLALTDLGSI